MEASMLAGRFMKQLSPSRISLLGCPEEYDPSTTYRLARWRP